jgi:mercuric reductase
VGSGGAAFGAALKASELGARVAMVERAALGGTCVNVGCVPSKTLIRAAEALHRARRTPFSGISVEGRLTDFSQVIAQKDSLVARLRQARYADVLSTLPTVQLFEGHGEFVERGTLRVGDMVLRADRFVIATGARPHAAAISGLAEAGFLTSTDALALKELPHSLIVLGGRYVALELAQAVARLGSKVTVVQRSDHVLPTEDDDLTDALAGFLREEGIDVLTSAHTRRIQRDGGDYLVDVEVLDEHRFLRSAQLLVATGRRPDTSGMGLESFPTNSASRLHPAPRAPRRVDSLRRIP